MSKEASPEFDLSHLDPVPGTPKDELNDEERVNRNAQLLSKLKAEDPAGNSEAMEQIVSREIIKKELRPGPRSEKVN